MSDDTLQDVVIIGGGIIGVSSAYFLSKYHNVRPLILEAKEVAWSASGKAGGFLAKDWAQGASAPFASASFDFHDKLSSELSGSTRYQYRKLTTLELFVPQGEEVEVEGGEELGEEEKELMKGMDWVTGGVTRVGKIGSEATTAQVHPRELTYVLLEEALKNGTKIQENSPVDHIKIVKTTQNDQQQTIVELHMCDKQIIQAKKIILCAGAWTHFFTEQLPGLPDIRGLYVPSVVVEPTAEITPHAIFGFMAKGQKLVSPEIYPRPDNTVFICGLNDPTVPVPDLRSFYSPSPSSSTTSPSSPPPQKRKKQDLPSSPSSPSSSSSSPSSSSLDPVPPNFEKSAWLHTVFGGGVSTHIRDGKRVASQACFVPSAASRSPPFIGYLTPEVFVAGNHGVWGILMGPLTGKMVGMVVGGEGEGVESEVKTWGKGGEQAWKEISSI